MVVVAGAVALVLYGVLVAFQIALAAGAPWGRAAYGGTHPGVLPARMRVSSAVAVVVWTAVALAVARRAGVPVWAPFPDDWLPVVAWVAVALGVVGVLLNTITRSRLERAIWLPVSLGLLLTTVVVALF